MKRTKVYLIGLCLLIASAYLIKEALGNGDFKVFLEAAKLLVSGETPYSNWIFVSEGNYCLYFYSPLWASLLIPFSYLPSFVTHLLWLLASVYFLYRTGYLLRSYFSDVLLSNKQLRWVLLLSIALSFRFILYNFAMIQMTTFLLWGVLECIQLNNKRKYLLAGILLALIINIKVLPIVLLPYFIYRSAYKTVLVSIVFSLFFLLLPAVAIGWDFNLELLADWWKTINPINKEHLLETQLGAHSLTAIVSPFFTEFEAHKVIRNENQIALGAQSAIIVVNCIRALLLFAMLFFLKWPPFKKNKSKLHEVWELSFLLLLIPLLFPRQQKYAFLMALPAQVYLSFFLVKFYTIRKKTFKLFHWIFIIVLIVLSFLLMTATSDAFIGRNLNKWTQHYKLITYGALALAIVLPFCSYEKFEKLKASNKKTDDG